MKNMERVGIWAFYAGLIVAAIAALISPQQLNLLAALVLGILGIIIGLLNVVNKEIKLYLLASITFIAGATALGAILSTIPGLGSFIPTFLDAIVLLVAPGAAVVALRALWDIMKDK